MELKFSQNPETAQAAQSFNRTKWNWNWPDDLYTYSQCGLLIVLNGIEIVVNVRPVRFVSLLLIVLNGIEIYICECKSPPPEAFNRTKWNWNPKRRNLTRFHCTFNRTKWNWNLNCTSLLIPSFILLIVLNGIEIGKHLQQSSSLYLLIVLNGIEIARSSEGVCK